jgi:regulator of RNase E activity RraA
MQVFARGVVPSHGRVHLMGIGQPVEVAGLRVTNGALLHGDENGVVDIPLEISDRIEATADQIRDHELAYFAAMHKPGTAYAEVRQWLAPH